MACLSFGPADEAWAQEDKYADYYYPPVTSEETFSRVMTGGEPADQEVRVNFVTAITKAQLAAPESPRFVIFEKGSESRNLIIVALDDEVFRTVFRARALLAQMTSNMRGTEFFRKQNLHLEGTLYDMLQVMGFTSLVVSDGATWAHRVNFAPEE
ncbi:hypothetical protein G5B40_13860 [Pikeienuella piscinae]|uniref:Uncharacterized protein n=1 Tax=Pikeienuella piscinae TaxID=2748098 RepID=A0A7M3T7B3_9RHOB|nr:hypothetical protein G5B40_13860 [Pikeienuella piscinae]